MTEQLHVRLRPDEIRAWRLSIEAAQDADGVPLGAFNWPWVLSRVLDEREALVAEVAQLRTETATGAHRGTTRAQAGEFDPDWTLNPRTTLVEIMKERRWSIDHVAEQTETRVLDCVAYLAGTDPYPASWAVSFAEMVGCSAQFIWNLQNNYLLALALGKTDVS